MALTLSSLTGIAADARSLVTEIGNLRQAGVDDKTDALEAKALAAIEKVRNAVEEASQPGSAQKADLEETLKEQLKTVEHRIANDPTLDTSAIAALLHDKAAIRAQLATAIFSGVVSWNTLLNGEDLASFRETVAAAAAEVRHRKKLARIVQSVFSAFRIGLGIAAKIVAL